MTVHHQPLAAFNWKSVAAEVTANGAAVLRNLLPPASCETVAALYDQPEGFRSHVHMARHNFGKGEYRYFAYPLPSWLGELRSELYARLAPIANQWATDLSYERDFPSLHDEYIERCHAAEQRRPTPLLLRYVQGDYNCLHQDLYGEHLFPLQITVLLSEPGHEFTGGEFVLTEQRPRMQTRAAVVPLTKGDAVVFAVNSRPVQGVRGDYRVKLRHGVSRIREGHRHTLGIIFHDAA